MDRNRLHLLHIRDAIPKIEAYSKGISYTDFSRRRLIFDAIMMQVIVIGEAVNSLSDEFKDLHHNMPWDKVVGLRNRTAHGYLDIEPEIVWQTIKEDLPKLKKQISKILG